jgi:hypothetical protein
MSDYHTYIDIKEFIKPYSPTDMYNMCLDGHLEFKRNKHFDTAYTIDIGYISKTKFGRRDNNIPIKQETIQLRTAFPTLIL